MLFIRQKNARYGRFAWCVPRAKTCSALVADEPCIDECCRFVNTFASYVVPNLWANSSLVFLIQLFLYNTKTFKRHLYQTLSKLI